MKIFRIGFVFLCMLLAAPLVASGMTTLGDRDLAACHAGSGISLEVTGNIQFSADSYWYKDTAYAAPGNKIEFNNIVWDNGSGGQVSFSTPAGDPVTIDIGTNITGSQTLLAMHNSILLDPSTLEYSLRFCNQTLGSIKISDIVSTEKDFWLGAHGGVTFENREKISIGSAQYVYNTPSTDNALTLSGIHFFGTADGDWEGAPSTWKYTGTGPFKIGDIAGGNPAQIDVGTIDPGVTATKLELPMTGGIRVENVTFGTQNFGPLELSGLNVHHLTIQFHP